MMRFSTVTNTTDHSNIPSDLGIETIYQLSTVWNHLVVGMASPPKSPEGAPPSTVSAMCYAELWHQKALSFLARKGPFPMKKSKSLSGRWRNLRDVQWCRYCHVLIENVHDWCWWMEPVATMLHRSEVGNALIIRTSKPGCRLRAFVSRSTSPAAGWGPGAV